MADGDRAPASPFGEWPHCEGSGRPLALNAATRQDRRAKPSHDAVENHRDGVDLVCDVQLQSPCPEMSFDGCAQTVPNRGQDVATRRRFDKGDWAIVCVITVVSPVDKEELLAKQRRRRQTCQGPASGYYGEIKMSGADAVAQ